MKRVLMALLLSFSMALAACASAPADNTSNEPYGCDPDAAGACEPETPVKDESGFKEISFDDAINLFENQESGLLYFGFPGCPWCKDVVPLLSQEAKDAGETILYVRTRDDDKNRLYTDEQKAAIQPYLENYMSENDEGEMTLFVPLVVRVVDGKAVNGHVGTVEGHDAHERPLTDVETEELKQTLHELVVDEED